MNEINEYTEKIFEEIKHIDENSREYWVARELQQALDYKEWRKFDGVINNAKMSCQNSGFDVIGHFVRVDKLSINVNGGKRKIKDYKLSRYACYLIAQNGDSRKKVISLAQTYFAVQTRKQELIDKYYSDLPEDKKRLIIRKQIRNGNYSLNRTAVNSGVTDLARFHNSGYKGLYNGETADDIAKRKGLRYREDILDNMCSEELAANIFRISQTDAKLKRENINSDLKSNIIHYEVGKKVRDTIKELGGTMPENMPTPKKSIKEIEKNYQKKKKEIDIDKDLKIKE